MMVVRTHAGGVYTGDSKEWNAGVLPKKSRAVKAGLHDAGYVARVRIEKDEHMGCGKSGQKSR